jgi:hypothetical protein
MNNIILLNSIIVIFAIIVLGVFIYTFYNYIFTTKHNSINNVGIINKIKLSLFKLSSVGTVSTLVDYSSDTTVVRVTDEELNSLLEVVFREIGDSNYISVNLLQSLGLYTSTVVSYLQGLGYIIF